MPAPSIELIQAALATVDDPEIRKPITELDMVKAVVVGGDGVPEGHVRVEVWHTGVSRLGTMLRTLRLPL